MYNKIMGSFTYSKRETERTFELALKEVTAKKDGDKLIKLATRYAERAFGYVVKQKKLSTADLNLIEEFEDYLDEEDYLIVEAKLNDQ